MAYKGPRGSTSSTKMGIPGRNGNKPERWKQV